MTTTMRYQNVLVNWKSPGMVRQYFVGWRSNLYFQLLILK